jgi:pre-rRNA-processing protein TSR2
LQIALDQGLGSVDSERDFADLLDETLGYFQRNGGDANAEDLQDNFEMWFDQVFNLSLEDGSSLQVGRSLEELYRQVVVAGNSAPLTALKESQERIVGNQRSGTKIVANQEEGLTVEDNSEDSEDGSDSDEDMEDAGASSSAAPKKEKPEKVVDEDGFETVQRRRR